MGPGFATITDLPTIKSLMWPLKMYKHQTLVPPMRLKALYPKAHKWQLSLSQSLSNFVIAVYEAYLWFCVEWRRVRGGQDTFSWNKVTRKTLSAAVCLWIFLPIGRVLKRRKAARVGS
ncbi:unnamed protein product [Fusarium graminearum]|uniref:Uncharacterized protein n=1 Tax=Gibberella zeae TaxID=5518 RepID=A0A9N8RMX9_GIBZA|nr:unnamed protein product [Fusarium graminearum]